MSALYIIMNFNPRAPCGARPHWMTFVAAAALFQSTRPVWGATVMDTDGDNKEEVSIHAPRVGRDDIFRARVHPLNVSIHAPRVGRDIMECTTPFMTMGFNPRAPCGARLFA